MKKLFALFVIFAFCAAAVSGVSYGAEKDKPAPGKKIAVQRTVVPPRSSGISMFSGKIEKIDTADPANIKLQIKDDATGASRTVAVAPYTNVTKLTDISELKTGEVVRVMVRKVADNETAMGVLFGKIANLPPLRAPGAAKPAPKETVKK